MARPRSTNSSRVRAPIKRKRPTPRRARERRPVALVTGASSGIGQELAKVFAANGFDLVLVARRRGPLQQLAAACASKHGTEVTVLPMDLLDLAAPERIHAALRRKGISIEVLVNNAGVAIVDHFVANPLEAQLDLVRLNVIAPTALARLFLPDMIKRKKGRIMNVASVAAFQPTPSLAVYGASKAFILSLSESLAVELEGTGVTVTALCPGFTETPLVENVERRFHNPGIVPGFFMLDAATVAKEGYAACMAGTPVCVNGFTYEMLICLGRMQPRWAVRKIASMVSRRFHD
ncbi:MAG: SDR family oxidoreductase [Myxococcales bacterium]|nr:MAG: SDR family oxidoreductase [Myxococcales bacterium]